MVGAAFSSDFAGIGEGESSNIFNPTKRDVLEEERDLIEKVFSIVDKDKMGVIDADKLEEMFKLFGVEAHFVKPAIDRIMENISAESDGKISPEEFYKLLSQKFEEGDRRSEMEECFEKMSEKKQKNEKGEMVIDVEELYKIATMLGESDMDRDAVREMIGNFQDICDRKMQRDGVVNSKEEWFHGRITERAAGEFTIKSLGLKNVKPTTRGHARVKDEKEMKHFKADEVVKFKLGRVNKDPAGNETVDAIELQEPELNFDEFYIIMEHEL